MVTAALYALHGTYLHVLCASCKAEWTVGSPGLAVTLAALHLCLTAGAAHAGGVYGCVNGILDQVTVGRQQGLTVGRPACCLMLSLLSDARATSHNMR
jgi:hypothetical protein